MNPVNTTVELAAHQQAEHFDMATADAVLLEQGFVVIEGLLTPTEIQGIKDALAPWFGGKHFGRNNFEGICTERVYALLAKAPVIACIIEHPIILALLDRLLPPHYLLSAALAINVHPGETPQPLHTDDTSNKLPGPRPHPYTGISTIWAFDDFTDANGATEVLPRSHLWTDAHFAVELDARSPAAIEALANADTLLNNRNALNNSNALNRRLHKVTMPAGSAVVFLGNLVHRGGANLSEGIRLGITPQYCAPWFRQIENMVLAVPPAVAAQYSTRIQAMLGYSTIDPGFMGYVDGMHPRRLIDADYAGRRRQGQRS